MKNRAECRVLMPGFRFCRKNPASDISEAGRSDFSFEFLDRID